MNSLFLELPPQSSPIPTFSELRQKPRDASEAIWLLLIFGIMFSFYVGKDVVQAIIKQRDSKFIAEAEAEKAIRKEREDHIEFLESQVKQLYQERAFLMKVSGINSGFLKEEVSNVNSVSSTKSN